MAEAELGPSFGAELKVRIGPRKALPMLMVTTGLVQVCQCLGTAIPPNVYVTQDIEGICRSLAVLTGLTRSRTSIESGVRSRRSMQANCRR